MNETLRRIWPVALVAVVAVLYFWVGLAAHGWDRILGIAGGLVVLGALVVARRSRWAPMVLLAVGGLPLAVTTWWSIIDLTPTRRGQLTVEPRAVSEHLGTVCGHGNRPARKTLDQNGDETSKPGPVELTMEPTDPCLEIHDRDLLTCVPVAEPFDDLIDLRGADLLGSR